MTPELAGLLVFVGGVVFGYAGGRQHRLDDTPEAEMERL